MTGGNIALDDGSFVAELLGASVQGVCIPGTGVIIVFLGKQLICL